MTHVGSLERALTAEGVVFRFELPGGRTPPSTLPLDPGDAALITPPLRVLESLWLEDRLRLGDDGLLLPVAEVYRLEAPEAAPLGLPHTPEPIEVELRTSSFAGKPDFAVRPVIRHLRRGLLPDGTRRGAFLIVGDEVLLAPQPMVDLFRVLDAPPPAGLEEQLVYIGEVRRAAERCGAKLDAYLSGQEIIAPESIGVEVEVEAPDRVRIRPIAEGVAPENFPALTQGPTRGVYMQAEGTKRRRLVLSRQARTTADAVKRCPELTGADAARFFENPEAYLPEEIDLSRFSLRVRGLVPKRYNSQPYVRLQPSEKRDWFALGAELDAVPPANPLSGVPEEAGGRAEAPAGLPNDVAKEVSTQEAPPSISPAEYAALCEQVVQTGERYVLHNDAWIEIEPAAAVQYLNAWNAGEDDGRGGRGFRADKVPLVLDVISNLLDAEFVEAAFASPPTLELPEYPLPASLCADLMPHQQIGYRWMRYLHEGGLGGLLADDMGLGKTVQVISFLAHLADASQLQPSLVVLPTSLIENWRRELAKFCPRIRRVYVHTGGDRLRHPDAIAQWEVVLTTYETLRRDQLILGQVDWSVVACDEAQKVKNPTAQLTSAVKGMKAKLRLAMTGTPVENGLSELWCIVDWAQPGKLGSQREFRERFERPMQTGEAEDRATLALQLQHELTPHYIRRTKEDVLQGLPPRTDEQRIVGMGPRQQRLYAEIVRQVRAENMIPIEGLQHLIAVASHPELFDASGAPITGLIDECPKLQLILAILDDIRARREKAVVFTRYRGMQRILQDAIAHRFGTHASILNGEVAGGHRQTLVDRFNQGEGFGALILSPEAAGVGLNIVGANHVIHYTRLWNPAKENQATDRVHRIGQIRPVMVYFPIVGGGEVPSVEERLDQLLAEKRALARDVVRPRESLSVERELFDIFEMPEAV